MWDYLFVQISTISPQTKSPTSARHGDDLWYILEQRVSMYAHLHTWKTICSIEIKILFTVLKHTP